MSEDFGVNQGLVEELYLKYRENPSSVDSAWQRYFDGLSEDLVPARHTRNGLTSPGAVQAVSSAKAPPNVQAAPVSTSGQQAAQSSTSQSGSWNLSLGTLSSETRLGSAAERRSFVPGPETRTATELQNRVSALVNAYRERGHLFADLDPLDLQKTPEFNLNLDAFGLGDVDPETVFDASDIVGPNALTLREIDERMRETYCRSIGVEFLEMDSLEERQWLQSRMESTLNHCDLSREQQLAILSKLTDAEVWETFVHNTYKGAKRFSVEGAESTIPLIDLIIERASQHGAEEVAVGMAHRGRLNMLVNVMGQPPQDLIAAFEDNAPQNKMGRGDVKYHLGSSSDRMFGDKKVHLTMAFNPSHLEIVNPVVEGRVRAKQDRRGDIDRVKVLPLLIHGDAAFIGQGVVAETLNLANLRGYGTGGTVHVVINNQIGYTTAVEDARSTRYCTDITRMLRCPVFHVNGEDPEAVAQVAFLAAEYRQKFHKDVVVDLYCYRRYGHNEGDEPRFTQPVMYQAIDQKESVRKIFVRKLVESGQLTVADGERIADESRARLEQALHEVRESKREFEPQAFTHLWSNYRGGPDLQTPDTSTAVDREKLRELLYKLSNVPEGFTTMRQIGEVLKSYRNAADTGSEIRWGVAENLAYATLLVEGHNVRVSGQDSERGTFAHRNAVLYDAKTGTKHVPLHFLQPNQARFEVYDSSLSEAGVMGFEYGYSLDSPDGLVIWEAQFGDFANGAQVIIDQFLCSSEDKWHRLSGLVLLLPHGFEGAGPEHSSARLERFLSLAAEDNIQVLNLTTAAQIFHALRRQVKRPWRKPMVIMSPKSLLRSNDAASSLDDFANGEFQRIIPDRQVPAKKVKRVLLCSGKVYYDLAKRRRDEGREDIAIVRLEQLYPIRSQEILDTLSVYEAGTDLVWVQEEPANSGAWYYINAKLPPMLDGGMSLRCIARIESASPATGSGGAHKLEQQNLVDEAFEPTAAKAPKKAPKANAQA